MEGFRLILPASEQAIFSKKNRLKIGSTPAAKKKIPQLSGISRYLYYPAELIIKKSLTTVIWRSGSYFLPKKTLILKTFKII